MYGIKKWHLFSESYPQIYNRRSLGYLMRAFWLKLRVSSTEGNVYHSCSLYIFTCKIVMGAISVTNLFHIKSRLPNLGTKKIELNLLFIVILLCSVGNIFFLQSHITCCNFEGPVYDLPQILITKHRYRKGCEPLFF